MNKELQTIYVPTNKEITYDGYLSVRKIFPGGRDKVIEEQVEKQSKIILSQEEWDEINEIKSKYELLKKAAFNLEHCEKANSNMKFELKEKDKEIERLKNLIPISWYDGYCKSVEKELAYDLLENFKKENNI